MKTKTILPIIITILLISCCFSSATLISIKKTNHINITKNNILCPGSTNANQAELPEWSVGNNWTYDMSFVFNTYKDKQGNNPALKVGASITEMTALVKAITEKYDEMVYVLSLNGDLKGNASIFVFSEIEIPLAELDGSFRGHAYISKNTLAIKEFKFEVAGQINIPVFGQKDFVFDMSMKFKPSFNFLNFTIDENDDPWEIHIENASLNAYFKIYDIPIIPDPSIEYENFMEFNDTMNVKRTETITVPAGTFDTFLLNGTWGYLSNLWYAPETGYLAKVEEGLNWIDEEDEDEDVGMITSEFYLDLIETNFNSTNHPPDKPEKPSGPPNGLTGEEYTYTTMANDTDGDYIAYLFDWGDGFTTRVPETGYVPSGTSVTASHRWFQRGAYNVIARSEDENGIMSNSWSDPLIVTISSGTPIVTVNMHRIHNLYPLDRIDNPYDDEDYPEWYYKITVESKDTYVDRFHNTDTGDWRDNFDKWISDSNWYPDIEHSYYEDHEFQADSRNINITIKLMDHDTGNFPEYGDDLADISGSNDPDDKGCNNAVPDNHRGAIFHGVYDLASDNLNQSKSDYYEKDPNGIYYIIRGDDEPDGSENYEADPLDAENDAEVWFAIYDDYEPPQATIQITNRPDIIRPNYDLQFTGTVTNGIPLYSWYWDFGDGATSEEQNPTRQYANNGVYTVTLTVTDGFNQNNSQSIKQLNVVERPPNAPTITGPTSGKPGKRYDYDYTFTTTDPDGDDVYYYIDWGDDNTENWIGPYWSDEEITIRHTWNEKGTYTIRAKAKDIYNVESDWSTLKVSMPKNRQSVNPSITHFLERVPFLARLFQHFPVFNNLLRL